MKTLLSSRERVRGYKRSAWEAWLVPSHHQISKIVSGLKKKETTGIVASFRCCVIPWHKRGIVSALRKKNKSVSSNRTQNIQICTLSELVNITAVPLQTEFPWSYPRTRAASPGHIWNRAHLAEYSYKGFLREFTDMNAEVLILYRHL